METPLIRSLLASLAFALGLPTAFSQSTERVSVDSSGIQGNSDSLWIPSISADGRFVSFVSYATNLVPGDTNNEYDVFVHVRQTSQTTRVSLDSAGFQGTGGSHEPSISADGRFVAFRSSASNLVPGDTNHCDDVFVHDRQTAWTMRVSVDSGRAQGSQASAAPCISSDGRFVAFDSKANNLVPSDTNNASDVFVHDRQTGQTTRVSVDSGGIQGKGGSYDPSLSADGRFVAFWSNAYNLVPGDADGNADIFVHDRHTGQTTRVSVDSGGVQGNGSSYYSCISSDGRLVTFLSYASNLVLGDTNGWEDIFVNDRQTGQTTRVSVDSGGLQGNSYCGVPSISADGRFVTFGSYSSTLVPSDTNHAYDVFAHDRQTGQTTRVSVNSEGSQGNADSNAATISFDGRFVAYASSASNLVPGDKNIYRGGYVDIFVHDRKPITPTLAAQGSCPGLLTLTLDAATPEGGVAFALGATGSFTLTSSVCAGTILDIANPQLGPVIRASWLGTINRTYRTSPAMCGLTVQALDIQTCKTSNAVVL